MQTWVIWLIPVVVLLAIATTAARLRRTRSHHPLTHEQALRELRRARRESHFPSRYDPSDTQCQPNGYATGSGHLTP
jgi:hypothetical protein